MKIIIIIILFTQIILPQNLTQEQKISIIDNLDSTKWLNRSNAIQKILEYNIPEALPKLEEKIFMQEQDLALFYLFAIDKYNSINTINIAKRFIDTISYLKTYLIPENIYDLKAQAVRILFERGDYSRTSFLFDYIESSKPGIAIIPFDLLPDVIEHVPEYSLQAKEELLRIIQLPEEGFAYYGPMALITLTDKYGDEFIPDLVNIIQSNTTGQMKFIAYDKLKERNYSEMEAITKYLFLNEKDFTIEWLNKLLTEYATPANYKFLQENFQSILSPEWLSAYQEYFQQSKLSNPLYPPSFNNLFEQFDYFKNLCDSLLSYTWLGDLTFSNELKNILTTSQTNLQVGDSLACRVQVKAFQDLVDNVYKDSLNTDARFVTIEGWKFLYWNAQYILDRLPEPPVIVNADIEVINPVMSLVNPGAFTMEVKGTGFSANFTVYFNGSARATTFISDSVLNVQIISTDVTVAGNYPVWVSDGTTNSDTLIYKVVSTLPQPVRPVLECVRNNGDGTYTAYFGYKNDNTVSVYIPAGSKNKFTPTPQDRGQTRVFEPGRHYKVFTVDFNGSNLVWTLNGRTSTASSNSAPCN